MLFFLARGWYETPPPMCAMRCYFLSFDLSVWVVLTFHSSWQHVWILDIFACPWMTWDWLRYEELFSFISVFAVVVVLTFGSFKWYFVDILACPGKTWDWLRHESLCAMRSAPEVLARAGPWCPPPSSWCPPPSPPGAHGSRLHGFQLDGTASQKQDSTQGLLKNRRKFKRRSIRGVKDEREDEAKGDSLKEGAMGLIVSPESWELPRASSLAGAQLSSTDAGTITGILFGRA